jgi:hypothetical protein
MVSWTDGPEPADPAAVRAVESASVPQNHAAAAAINARFRDRPQPDGSVLSVLCICAIVGGVGTRMNCCRATIDKVSQP